MCAMSVTAQFTSAAGRRISFQPEAIFQSIIQDGDTHDVWMFLNNKDIFDVEIDQPNHTGITALHQSVLNNNLDIVKLLLNSGADVNMADVNGLTPLHTASACGFLHMASMLIMFGANIFAQTDQGDLPVDFAKDNVMTLFLHTEMVKHIQSQHFMMSLIIRHASEWILWLQRKLMIYFRHLVQFIISNFRELTTKTKSRKSPACDEVTDVDTITKVD